MLNQDPHRLLEHPNKPITLTGAEFRYIRSAGMLLSHLAVGKLMGIDGQSVARWEKTSKVPRWADKLVRRRQH
jgi:DNA-binding transcriptional regulator YiaG